MYTFVCSYLTVSHPLLVVITPHTLRIVICMLAPQCMNVLCRSVNDFFFFRSKTNTTLIVIHYLNQGKQSLFLLRFFVHEKKLKSIRFKSKLSRPQKYVLSTKKQLRQQCMLHSPIYREK